MPSPPANVGVCLTVALACALSGCQSAPKNDLADLIAPSNFRDWAPNQAVLPTSELERGTLSIKNVRYCKHLAAGEYVVDHYDKSFRLDQVQAVDFITMPFGPIPGLAHTLVSFEIAPPAGSNAEPDHLAISVEVRKEKGEEVFNPALGAMRQYEIMYVVADERDVVAQQTNIHREEVYVYRTVAGPEAAQDMLLDMLDRANKLAEQPEFYDLFTNNCTTNIAQHVNRIRPNRIAYDLGVLLPGYSAHKAYLDGLLAGEGSFEEIKARSAIMRKAQLADGAADFSRAIRR